MCGIFGISMGRGTELPGLSRQLDRLFKLSETRGKEASGLAILSGDCITIEKAAESASEFIRSPEYRDLLRSVIKGANSGGDPGPVCAVGHSRLVTNGLPGNAENNQPVARDGVVAVHNGIVVNVDYLWADHQDLKRHFEVDSEVIPALLRKHLNGGDGIEGAAKKVFSEIEGSASCAVLFEDMAHMLLATNTGSLYYVSNEKRSVFLFSSERFILEQFADREGSRIGIFREKIEQLRAGTGATVNLSDNSFASFDLGADQLPSTLPTSSKYLIRDRKVEDAQRREELTRCSRCILPETVPGISFDSDGVCSICRSYKKIEYHGKEALEALLAKHRRTDGKPDSIMCFSGGRDSSYGLHYLVKEMGMNPIAYTYDWGMVTDIARRNQARICGKLGVEHVIISADIKEKRANIRRNVNAWLKNPQLGMIPLFMAGDKQYFYYADQMRKKTGLDLVVLCGSLFEKTNFKSGFCGVDEGEGRLYNVSLAKKAKMASYFAKNFLKSPAYVNRSLVDTAFAFFSSYLMDHNFTWLFHYIPWDEKEINQTLAREYDWEIAKDTEDTWRIGDGTAAFYNYIYYTAAGFTEHDTLLSNQIREGILTREAALKKIRIANQPRFDSIRQYAYQIGLDYDQVMTVVESIPKLYAARQ